MSKTALITGIRGQDGAYLSELLLKKGYRVVGADRRSGDSSNWRLKELRIEKDIEILYMDLLEFDNIFRVLQKVQPDEIYNLAAQSFVSASFDQPILTTEVDAVGVVRLLEAIRIINPKIKFYQASSSEMFGKARTPQQNEETCFYPRSPYAVSKVFGHWITVNYRESFQLFACSGILFNHESPLRGIEFVTRKITYGLARIKYGKQKKLILGNIEAKRDWGYAKEYVEGMWMMLQQKEPDDYVLATGETHSIKEFVERSFSLVGYEIVWQGKEENLKGIDRKTNKILIEISKDLYRPAEVDYLLGDYTKAKQKLGWQPKVTFEKLIEIMVEADLKRVANEL